MLQPFVSIIVPVLNEERHIERCLNSIVCQDFPRERFEIIVVDGGSRDLTRQIVSRFAAEYDVDLRFFSNPQRRTAAAINIGIRNARGDVIVRVDGHAAVAPDFIKCSAQVLSETGADCVGGVLQSEGDTYVGRAIALAMSSPFGAGGAAFRTGGGGDVDTVAFGAYRREVFDRIGLFAEDIDKGEDDEFNYRLRDSGGRIVLDPRIRVYYTVRDGFPALWRQYFGYGRAKPKVLRRHPCQLQPRQLAPLALVLAFAASGFAAIAGKTLMLKVIVAVYTGAATIASLALARRHGWRFLPPLPIAFVCLHLPYGLGFLAGLLGLARGIFARAARSVAHQSTEAPK